MPKRTKHWPKVVVAAALVLAAASALAGTALPLLKMIWS